MWRFIWFLIILVLSVWLGLQIAKDPGLAFFSYQQWSVEMPLWFAVLALIFTIIILYSILRLFDQTGNLIYRWKSWLQWRKKHKSYSKTNRGLIELIEGHWKTAENNLLDGLAQSEAPLINYLALAKAAHEQAEYDKRDTYLRKAHAAAPQADTAIGLTQAQLQLNQGQLEQALATLNHLRTISPRHPSVLKLLERVYVHLGDWKSLLNLIPDLYKTHVINREQLAMLEKKTYEEYLKSSKSHEHDLNAQKELWNNIPRKWQKDPEIIACHVKELMKYPEANTEAEALICKALKKSWDAHLARLYGLIVSNDPKKQLTQAEKWLKLYDNQPILLLTLGRLSARCQLWGKARRYFEDSLNLEASPETFAEYGKLLDHLNDSTAAMESYRDGLELYLAKK